MQEENPKQATLDQRYLRMARIWAENSYCRRRKVGALVVKEKMIISDGYNGTPSGFENVCEDDNNVTKPYVLHAEANAITKLARSSNNSDGATLYVTSSPCIECSKLIIQAGIKRVVYDEQYRLDDGIQSSTASTTASSSSAAPASRSSTCPSKAATCPSKATTCPSKVATCPSKAATCPSMKIKISKSKGSPSPL